MGKSKKQKTTTTVSPPEEFRGAFGALGDISESLIGDVVSKPRQIPGFTGAQQKALSLTQGLSGSDPALGQAAGLFRNNPGVGLLKGIDIGQQRRQAINPLQQFSPDALRGVTFGALKGFDSGALKGLDFNQLKQTAGGEFLDVANQPFLAQALEDAQRRTTERFTQDVQPALAAQFGGGFGLTGSASIRAQTRAAEDLSRALSEQATSTFADQYTRERGLQEQARGLFSQLQLNRAGQIDQNALSRAQNLGQLQLGRAGQVDELGLSRASQLGQLGLGFTQADISRGANVGQLQNQAAAGLAGVGGQRRAQQAQRIGLLGSIGEQQRALQERQLNPIDDTISRLQGIGGIIGLGSPFNTTQASAGGGGGGGLTGALGGALSGGALGSQFGPLGIGIGAIGGGILGAF